MHKMRLISTLLKCWTKKRTKEEVNEVTVFPVITEKEEINEATTITSSTTYPSIPSLGLDVWYSILARLSIQELCRLCAISPYFYKLAHVDFKWMCETYFIFRLEHETYVEAFGEFKSRDLTYYSVTSVCNQQMAFYSSVHRAVLITGLNCNHEQVLCLKLDLECKDRCTNNICLYKNCELLMFETCKQVFIYNVPARALLLTFKRTHSSVYISHSFGSYYFIDYIESFDCYQLFNGLTQKFRTFSFTDKPFQTTADYIDDHQFFVFVTDRKIYFYDDVTERLVEVNNPFYTYEYVGQVLAKSKSYICGDCQSFHIYDLVHGLPVLVRRVAFVGEPWSSMCYHVLNDSVIVDISARKIFYYDPDESQWACVPSKRREIKQNVYNIIFHLEDFIWNYKLTPSESLKDIPGLRIWDYLKIVEAQTDKFAKINPIRA